MAKAPGKKLGRKKPKPFTLQITSMMDMFTIILVFLLKSVSSTPEASVTISPDIKLPTSLSDKDPINAVAVVVTQRGITVDNMGQMTIVAEFTDFQKGVIAGSDGFAIQPLIDAMSSIAEKQRELNAYKTDAVFKGEVLIQADQQIPFSIMKKVLYSIGQAEFGEFKFITIAESEG